MARIDELKAAKDAAKAEARRCEERAIAAIRLGNREAHEHWTEMAAAAWGRNWQAVGELDRLMGV